MATQINLPGRRSCAGHRPEVEADDLGLAVFNIDGKILRDRPLHPRARLAVEGYIDGDVIECNFHNGQFNIRTGGRIAPCMGAGEDLFDRGGGR